MLPERLLRRLGPKPRPLPMVDPQIRLDSYPPPFPAGWYPVAMTAELGVGDTKFVQALGQQVVVFRGEDGVVGALDAYCPHLGANLAGGQVRDGCIECPFHRWTFDRQGQVRSIPNVDKPSPSLKTRSWTVTEIDGHVGLWWDGGGSPACASANEPDYALEPLEEGLIHRGDHDAGLVRMHLCEFSENSVDFQHFAPIHGKMMVPWLGFKIPGVDVQHVAEWEADEIETHKAYFRNEAVLVIGGRARPATRASAIITFYGPAGFTTFRVTLPELGDIVVYHTHLPVEPMVQHVRFRWFADAKIPRPLVSYVVGSWIAQWRADIGIWENKVFNRKPMLIAEDGPVHEMRRWFQQFYPAPNNGRATREPAGEHVAAP
jgi:cholesterol 7-desaturase